MFFLLNCCIMARPSYKTSGFGCTVNVDFTSFVWWQILKCKVRGSKLKVDKFSCPLGEY